MPSTAAALPLFFVCPLRAISSGRTPQGTSCCTKPKPDYRRIPSRMSLLLSLWTGKSSPIAFARSRAGDWNSCLPVSTPSSAVENGLSDQGVTKRPRKMTGVARTQSTCALATLSNPRHKKVGFDDVAQQRRSPFRATRRARRAAPSNPAGRTIFTRSATLPR